MNIVKSSTDAILVEAALYVDCLLIAAGHLSPGAAQTTQWTKLLDAVAWDIVSLIAKGAEPSKSSASTCINTTILDGTTR